MPRPRPRALAIPAGSQQVFVGRRHAAGAVVPSTTEAPSEPARGQQDTVQDLRDVLLREGVVAAAQRAFARLGVYAGNEAAWHAVTRLLVEEDRPLKALTLAGLKRLVQVLGVEAQVMQKTFWDTLTPKVEHALDTKVADLQDLLELSEMYAGIKSWRPEVFGALVRKVQSENAVHTMDPTALTRLLSTFSKAGANATQLSRMATQLFNEMEERVSYDAADFQVDECIELVESMARFRAVSEPVLRQLGRERLHAELLELPGPRIATVCHAYGELGWRHDTVFKTVSLAILEEHERLQRSRVLGEVVAGSAKFSVSDIALVVLALLRLKMYRGNTDWCKWADNYKELLDILNKRVENELQGMQAKPLAAAAFALGRARRGTEEMYKAMYARMMQLLEAAPHSAEPPQEELERFMHGLAMMGPTRKKNLDTFWLMQWLCNNFYLFVLSDLILINRHLVLMRCFDKEYLKEFLEKFFSKDEVMKQLKKSDIMELTNTYNGARIREEEVGRHFFWALGRRFQQLQVEATGRRRPPLQRIG